LLGNLRSNNLLHLFESIHPSITNLNLGKNGFNKALGLERALKVISTVIELDLSENEFGRMNASELTIAVSSIPTSVTQLKLGDNCLFRLAANGGLDRVLAAIPKGVTKLLLNQNQFSLVKSAKLATAFAAIPSGIHTLDLYSNFYRMNCKDLCLALIGLPDNIRELTLAHEDIQHYSPDERILLGHALPHLMKLHALDEDHKPVNPFLIKKITDYIGHWIATTYKELVNIKNQTSFQQFPTAIPIAYTVMTSLTGNEKELIPFIKSRKEITNPLFFKNLANQIMEDEHSKKLMLDMLGGWSY
jgi:hypothetical protein